MTSSYRHLHTPRLTLLTLQTDYRTTSSAQHRDSRHSTALRVPDVAAITRRSHPFSSASFEMSPRLRPRRFPVARRRSATQRPRFHCETGSDPRRNASRIRGVSLAHAQRWLMRRALPTDLDHWLWLPESTGVCRPWQDSSQRRCSSASRSPGPGPSRFCGRSRARSEQARRVSGCFDPHPADVVLGHASLTSALSRVCFDGPGPETRPR
jgi:hypothetical protein